jgi:lycopene beta-cyclase
MKARLVLVGGGLQNALVALAILRKDPGADLLLLEREGHLGGNHTWCFHASDLPPAIAPVLDDLIVRSWPGHTVAFQNLTRILDTPYAAISSARLDSVLTAALRAGSRRRLLLETPVVQSGSRWVVTADGARIDADRVLDARGPPATGGSAFQKFLGLELRLSSPWRRRLPSVMDARADQRDGFRFLYTLPFSADRVLVEDTSYSEQPDLDVEGLRKGILAHVREHGSEVEEVLREERGVLPLPLVPFSPAVEPVLQGGYAGGWFHPTTGYSFPAAARLAALMAESWPDSPSRPSLLRLRTELTAQIRFFTRLNRLLFEACSPAERWKILERFYRLPAETIVRFYAMRTTRMDRARILLGRPPGRLAWRKALRVLADHRGVA